MATTQKKRTPLTDAYQQYATGGNQEGIKKLSEYKNIVNQGTSALSNLNTANQTALKYADTAMQAQGFSTQGANTQNITNLQNAYMNQVGQQNLATQQQVGQLKDTTSANALQDLSSSLAGYVSTDTLTQDALDGLQKVYYDQLNPNDLAKARLLIDSTIREQNNLTNEESLQSVESDNTFTHTYGNNVQATTTFHQGSKRNKNVIVSINGNNYKVELGAKLSTYGTFDKGEPEAIFKDKQIGEIWEYKFKSGGSALLIKDENGNIRLVEKTAFNNKDLKSLKESLGYTK